MKIKCRKIISPNTKQDLGDASSWLTVGKEYIVLALNIRDNFGILAMIQTDHHNEPAFISLDGFEIISQHIPSNWKNHVDNFGFFYKLPEKWIYDSFWEELEDEKENAVNLFIEESRVIYREEGVVWG